jgi:hypothetical protein
MFLSFRELSRCNKGNVKRFAFVGSDSGSHRGRRPRDLVLLEDIEDLVLAGGCRRISCNQGQGEDEKAGGQK